ncbi:MAG: DNRLRE domain-containing protein [Gammaproteobacteria bacterium]|nr:DNRLRE domain-containing protein [Gammaproteobacteria bacterium]
MEHTPRLSQVAIVVFSLGMGVAEGQAAVVRVPQNYATIQAAIDAAATGDTVLVSRGTYAGDLVISEKTITLASEYINTGDANDVTQTIVTGGDPMIEIDATAVDTTVQGISFQTGGYGLVNYAPRMNIVDNRFIDTGDAVSFETAGGVARGNYFDGASDDGIDVDHAEFDVTLENNTILNSKDDGIEIRVHPYTGPMVNIVIRNNYISGNKADGIQLIDYSGLSNRIFRIERNVIVNNAKVGLGCMADGNTTENFAGAPMVEEVQVVNNTFSGNAYGITSSDNMLVMNNIIDSMQIGLKRASASSLASYNDFWNNGTNYTTSNVDTATTIFQNPLFDENYNLQPDSLCIDAGAASVLWNGKTVNAPSYNDAAPDLGAKETLGGPVLPTVTVAASDTSAAELGADPGVFAVSRTGDTSAELTVLYALGGTAVNGTDYALLLESVTIPAGASSANVVVIPVNDAEAEGNETVVLTVTSDTEYTVGNPSGATLTLAADALNLPTATIVATDPSAFEAGPDPGVFTISRTGDTSAPLTVTYSIGGNATEGVDYESIDTSVTIPVGAASATVTIQPIDDLVVDDEEVALTLAPDVFYVVGVPGTATVTITDNDSAFTVSFQDGVSPTSGYVGTTDTRLSESSAKSNYGTSSTVRVDGEDSDEENRYGLLKWDLSSIPAGSLVQSVTITLEMTDTSVNTYELYEIKRPWVETQATWNVYATGASWQVPGAKGSLDRGTAVVGTVAAPAVGSHTLSLNSSGVDLVQSWVNSASANNGIIVANPTNPNGLTFRSRNATTPSTRPKMMVTYVVAQ